MVSQFVVIPILKCCRKLDCLAINSTVDTLHPTLNELKLNARTDTTGESLTAGLVHAKSEAVLNVDVLCYARLVNSNNVSSRLIYHWDIGDTGHNKPQLPETSAPYYRNVLGRRRTIDKEKFVLCI
jgi:hypothetical protein